MDPGEYVYSRDGEFIVCLYSEVEPRCARVWEVVLAQFVAMGSTRTSARADAWRLQHDLDFHHTWASDLPRWAPTLAYYIPKED